MTDTTDRKPDQKTDQYTEQDPKQQFGQPATQGKEIPAVGESGSTTDQMDSTPDHGEQSYRGSGRLTGRRALITGGHIPHQASFG